MTDDVYDQPGTETMIDYFGFGSQQVFVLPDGKQSITYKAMNEGDRARFQKLTQRDVIVERKSGDAKMRVNPAIERRALIQTSVTDWNLYRGGQPLPFSQRALDDFLTLTNPKLIDQLESAIRKANPWLTSELTVEEIDEQIEELQELRIAAAERAEGEAGSETK